MSWIVIALMSAATTSLVFISDKTVMHRYSRSPLTLPLLIGIAQTIIGLVVLGWTRIPSEATLVSSVSAALSGTLYGLGAIFSLRILFTQEVSRTIPVTQSAPIFASILALVILNESISSIQWLGIIATVVGSTILSLRIRDNIGSIFLHRSFYLLMFSAFLYGAANVVGKLALEELPVLYTHGLRTLALGLIFLSVAARSEPWIDVKGYFLSRSVALVFVSINEFIIANIGLLLLLWALSLGPASLVTAVVGTRALFVVIYSTTLATVWRGALGEQTSPGIVTTKILSAVLIVSGVAVISVG